MRVMASELRKHQAASRRASRDGFFVENHFQTHVLVLSDRLLHSGALSRRKVVSQTPKRRATLVSN